MDNFSYRRKTLGFTLVELSIVIIIIGFLIAGITAGKSLIEQAKLHTVINELEEYRLMANNFRVTYNALPGDMYNASSMFPNCNPSVPESCNGDGSGVIGDSHNQRDETTLVWRHLYFANMFFKVKPTEIWTNWSPYPPWTGGFLISPGDFQYNYEGWYPKSALSDKVIAMVGGPSVTPWFIATPFDASTSEVCIFRNQFPVTNAYERGGLTPEQTFQIDQKFDDGAINGGLFVGHHTGRFRAVSDNDSVAQGIANGCITAGGSYDMDQTNAFCIACLKLD
jgi:prepilin-type N-terminal cleavage/methylation domain-containing protein